MPWELSAFVALEVVAVTAQSLAVGLVVATPWEGVQSVSEVQSSVSIVGYLPLAPVKVECVSLTGGKVRGHLDAGASEFVSQVLVVQYHHLVPPAVELDYERAGLGAPTRKARLMSARYQHGEAENSFKKKQKNKKRQLFAAPR